MNKFDREKIKQAIKAKIELLKNHISGLESSTKPIAPDNAIGRVTRMDAIQNKVVGEAGLGRLRNDLEALEQKLTAVDGPDFGLCQFCGKPIALERLEFIPETDMCKDCASKYT